MSITLKVPFDIQVTKTFSATGTGIELAVPQGTEIPAGAAGSVAAVGANSVALRINNYRVEYGGLANIKVTAGAQVAEGAALGTAAGTAITLTITQFIDPALVLQKVTPPPKTDPSQIVLRYLRTTEDAINFRQTPGTGIVIGLVNTNDVLEIIEDVAAAAAKLGKVGQWIQVRSTLTGKTGYMSAAYLKPDDGPGTPTTTTPTPSGEILFGARNFTGMNLDMYNPQGAPDPSKLEGIGWIRVKFNMSLNPDKPQGDPARYGNKDVNATFNRVKPFIEKYVKAGLKVIMVFTHQLYGEGAGFNWETIDSSGWNRLIPTYADYAKQVAQKFAGTGLVHAYQIWNEQDTLREHMRAAVPIDATNYAKMLTQTIRAMRPVVGDAKIITGGHVTGNPKYAADTIKQIPSDALPDGIAFHPYGLGPGQSVSKWSNNGLLVNSIRGYGNILPGKPLWITEWGVLNVQGQDQHADSIKDYMASFLNICKQHSGQIAAAVWYAWADGMDNGYGLVRADGSPREPLYSSFKKQ